MLDTNIPHLAVLVSLQLNFFWIICVCVCVCGVDVGDCSQKFTYPLICLKD